MIYFDNSATTCLCDEAKREMLAAMDNFANPSSLHKAGQDAQKIITAARKSVANALGLRSVTPGQILFTSGGTEANNTAIFGTVYAKKRRVSNRIITTDSEHPSVENALSKLETDGFEVMRIPTVGGQLDFEAYAEALKKPPILVTMMMVNNETGAVYDVARAFEMAKKNNRETVTHCDAVQGFLKCRFTPSSIHADLISISAHKIHGPKGAGALYIDPAIIKAKQIIPLIYGGEQENAFRPGTENTVGIAGFGAAAEKGSKCLSESIAKMAELRLYAIEKLSGAGVELNLPKGEAAPHVISVRLPNIKSETMLHFLSANDICVSSGSACSSHSKKTSRALKAFGLSDREADCTVRVSLCEMNTKEDIDYLCSAVFKGVSTLIRIK
jgi:cysteine desulfurase